MHAVRVPFQVVRTRGKIGAQGAGEPLLERASHSQVDIQIFAVPEQIGALGAHEPAPAPNVH